MYGDDPRDFGMGPQWEDDEREVRTKSEEEDALDSNRPRTIVYDETNE